MEFLVLGPLEARSARESVALGGPRQRAVLADLLVHAGAVVSTDTLIDDLWAGTPPPTAEAVVQNAVMKLRRALGRDVIETRAPGYVLAVDPGAIDAGRFERLVRDAKPLPAAERSAALRDALALWRGDAFADLAFESFLQDEIARLDELRLTTLEDRLEAELELGHHDAVVPEASALRDRNPARERLCRLLMLALHRAGRQQEALDAYEALRRTLDERFGLEPAPETRALQRMILDQDPAIAVGEKPPASIGAVRRPIALLLVELLLDEDLELEAAGSILDDARRSLQEVVARHGGSLTSESGVELVAAFGADAAHEDDVLRAARSGVELHEILGGRDVDARLAVGTGQLLVEDGRPVLVGAVIGQARRALHDAESGQILLTPAAARLGGDSLELDAAGGLLGVRPGRLRASGLVVPLVGRADEVAALRAAYDRVVAAGRPEHVVVVGEAGIGKSRLVTAFVEEVPTVVLEAACIPYGAGISFLPLRELGERAEAIDHAAPEIGELASADAALAAARLLLEHFTASGPLVVLLDDVHWAVPTFLDLVEYLVRAVEGRLLLVTATRPELLEQRPAWGEAALRLQPLPLDDARRLVEAMPERDALDEKVATTIIETAEGVPLFLEQLAAHAVESDPADDRVPSTLDSLLASRIDALEVGERGVLERAAIVGRVFSRESVVALTPDAEVAELDGRLASLGRRRLVRSRGSEHEFVHVLVRDGTYGAIGRTERTGMHERFARYLDANAAGDEIVGTHLERAALDATDDGLRGALCREAAIRLGRAGARADARFDDWAALNLFERATALLGADDPDRLELECRLGKSLKEISELPRSVALLESVADRSHAIGNRHLELRAQVELVWPRLLDGSISAAAAGTLLDEAIECFDEVGDDLGVGRAEFAHVLRLGDFGTQADLASQHAARAEAAFCRAGIDGQISVAEVVLAVQGSATIDQAIQLCEQQFRAHPDHVRAHASLHVWLAYLHALKGDLDSARAYAATGRTELFELGMEVELEVVAADLIGSIEAHALEWQAAEGIFEKALAYTRRRGWHYSRAWGAYFVTRLAEVALACNDSERAARMAEEALRISPVGDRLTRVWTRRVSGRALAATGHPRKALTLAREALEIAGASDDLVERGEATLDLADVLEQAGRLDAAREAVVQGLELLDSKGATLPAANGRARFAELLAELESGARPSSDPADVPLSS